MNSLKFPVILLLSSCFLWGCGSNPAPTSPAPSAAATPTESYSFSLAFRVPRINGTNANVQGLAAGNGAIYVVDNSDHAIEVFTPNGVSVTFLGAASLAAPYGLAFDGASGTLFVADGTKGAVELDQNGYAVTTMSPGAITSPNNIALDPSGDFWLEGGTGTGNMVEKCTNAGGCGGVTLKLSLANASDNPFGVSVDNAGHVWVGDNNNFKMEEFDATTGNYLTAWGGPVTGSGPSTLTSAQFGSLSDSKADSRGNLLVLDAGMKVVKLLDPTGNYLQNFTNTDQISGLTAPNYMYVDAQDNIYVGSGSYVSVFKRN